MACGNCNQGSGSPSVVRAAKIVAHGVSGLARYSTRTGLAPSAVISKRRGKGGCGDCKFAKLGICPKCNCLIVAKTSLIEETCPLSTPRW